MKYSFLSFAVCLCAQLGFGNTVNAQTWAHVPDQVMGAINQFDSGALKNMNDQAFIETGIYSRYTPEYKRSYFQIMTGVVSESTRSTDLGQPCAIEVTDTNGETLFEIRLGDESDTSDARLHLDTDSFGVRSSDEKLTITSHFNPYYQQKLYSDAGKKPARAKITESLEFEKNTHHITAAKITVRTAPSLRARMDFSEKTEVSSLRCVDKSI